MRSRRTRIFRARIFRALAALGGLPALAAAGGCVERNLQIQSDPPGALVDLNGEETGRTPMRKSFLWYGTYDVLLRKEGYVTQSAKTPVWAPWWQIPPIDLIAEIIPLPLRDNRLVTYRLKPVSEAQTDPEQVIERAGELRARLKSTEHTRTPEGSKEWESVEGEGTGTEKGKR
jgi:PEGA domain-containing protein